MGRCLSVDHLSEMKSTTALEKVPVVNLIICVKKKKKSSSCTWTPGSKKTQKNPKLCTWVPMEKENEPNLKDMRERQGGKCQSRSFITHQISKLIFEKTFAFILSDLS